MFNLKLSFLNVLRSNNRQNLLPMDFGTMYFLYPSESGHYVGFGSTGIMDKVVDTIKAAFQKKDSDVDYYKTESFF
ncbi:MAG: hypothetical protein PF482_16585 [Desulfobacteraceae bacterium]|jgi:hypothetical protein|nr:hypothetical protein [Desulfobacteraceae bacterium]